MPSEACSIQGEHFRFLRTFVYAQSGIVLGEDKNYLLETRLAPIIRQLGLDSVGDLCNILTTKRQAAVTRQVAEAMTTNETYFFRDPIHYEAIKSKLIPELREVRKVTRKMSFWSAASSTGQEI